MAIKNFNIKFSIVLIINFLLITYIIYRYWKIKEGMDTSSKIGVDSVNIIDDNNSTAGLSVPPQLSVLPSLKASSSPSASTVNRSHNVPSMQTSNTLNLQAIPSYGVFKSPDFPVQPSARSYLHPNFIKLYDDSGYNIALDTLNTTYGCTVNKNNWMSNGNGIKAYNSIWNLFS